MAMKRTNAATFSAASTSLTSRPGPTPRRWIHAIPKMAAIATMLCGDAVSTSVPGMIGMREKRSVVRGRRNEATQIEREHDRAGRDGAGETRHERRPPGQEAGQRSERRAQVDVLAAGARPQRRQLRVGHRAGERQPAAGDPRREERQGARHRRGDLRRREQNAAADDVGDDECGGVERPETAFERLFGRGGGSGGHVGIIGEADEIKSQIPTANSQIDVSLDSLGSWKLEVGSYSVSSWRSI